MLSSGRYRVRVSTPSDSEGPPANQVDALIRSLPRRVGVLTRDRFINSESSIYHMIYSEFRSHTVLSGPAHAPAHISIIEQLRQRFGEGLRISRWDQNSSDTVFDDFG